MDNEQDKPPFENRIFKMAQQRVAEHNAALAARTGPKDPAPDERDPNYARSAVRKDGQAWGKTGPNGEPKWAEKVVKGIVVGRNKIVVPPEEVEHLASLGCTDREIADYFDVNENTLRYNFKQYLTKGRHQLRTTLRQAQLRVALDGNPTMLIWLGKNMLSQNEAGQANDDNRPLPWTDEMDNDTVEDLDDETTIQTQDDEDTAFE